MTVKIRDTLGLLDVARFIATSDATDKQKIGRLLGLLWATHYKRTVQMRCISTSNEILQTRLLIGGREFSMEEMETFGHNA